MRYNITSQIPIVIEPFTFMKNILSSFDWVKTA